MCFGRLCQKGIQQVGQQTFATDPGIVDELKKLDPETMIRNNDERLGDDAGPYRAVDLISNIEAHAAAHDGSLDDEGNEIENAAEFARIMEAVRAAGERETAKPVEVAVIDVAGNPH